MPSGECAGEKEGQRAYGREKLKEKNRGGGGKKGFDMDEGLANVEEGSVMRGDKKRDDERGKEKERESRIMRTRISNFESRFTRS